MLQLGSYSKYLIEFVRFFFVGGVCTLLTYLLYLLLLIWLNYQVAYTLAYLVGVVLSYFLNSFVTFKQKTSVKQFLTFPIVYIVQYIFGVLLLSIFVTYLNISKVLAPIIVIAVSLPLTFVLSRLVIVKK